VCKCVRDWIEDDDVVGDHNQIPVTCEQYIQDLEEIVRNLMRAQADNLTVIGGMELAAQQRLAAAGAWAGVYEIDSSRLPMHLQQQVSPDSDPLKST
jgi:hypothetical protein